MSYSKFDFSPNWGCREESLNTIAIHTIIDRMDKDEELYSTVKDYLDSKAAGIDKLREFVSVQLSVPEAELQTCVDFWRIQDITVPSWCAAYCIRRAKGPAQSAHKSICLRLNHPAGEGCGLPLRGPSMCKGRHICLYCGSGDHGAFMDTCEKGSLFIVAGTELLKKVNREDINNVTDLLMAFAACKRKLQGNLRQNGSTVAHTPVHIVTPSTPQSGPQSTVASGFSGVDDEKDPFPPLRQVLNLESHSQPESASTSHGISRTPATPKAKKKDSGADENKEETPDDTPSRLTDGTDIVGDLVREANGTENPNTDYDHDDADDDGDYFIICNAGFHEVKMFLGRELGRSDYCSVLEGEYFLYPDLPPETVAIKKITAPYSAIRNREDKARIEKKARDEYAILTQLSNRSPYIVSCYGTFPHQTLEERNLSFCLVMEKCDKDLAKYIQDNQNLNSAMVSEIVRQLISVYSTLHHPPGADQEIICHRDVKPENVLIKFSRNFSGGQHTEIRLCDFGVSRKLKPRDGQSSMQTASTLVGTFNEKKKQYWIPPEVTEGEPYTYTADLWSLGLLIHYVSNNGHMPMASVEVMRSCGSPDELSKLLREHDSGRIGHDMSDLIRSLVVFNPSDRLQCNQAIHHPAFWTHNRAGAIICCLVHSVLNENRGIANSPQRIFQVELEKLDKDQSLLELKEGETWMAKSIFEQLKFMRGYDESHGRSTFQLLQRVRNLFVHFGAVNPATNQIIHTNELTRIDTGENRSSSLPPPEINGAVVKKKCIEYLRERFPRLLSGLYHLLRKRATFNEQYPEITFN